MSEFFRRWSGPAFIGFQPDVPVATTSAIPARAVRLALAVPLTWLLAACPATSRAGADGGGTADAGSPVQDAGATDAAGLPETLCTNGNDDDHDDLKDCADPDCETAPDCTTEDTDATCDDGLDNDGDRYVDCTDFDCAGHGACGPPERDLAACRDDVDNDGDGYTDCADFGCRGLSICSRYEDRADTCRDGVDNDSDTYTDCADFGCRALAVCQVTETDAATCADGVDNDGDQVRDCLDTDCMSLAVCAGARVRVATWNVQQLTGGDPPSAQGQAAVDAVLAMLARMRPDVACLNEIHDDEADALAAAAAVAGYPHVFQGAISTPMAGGLTNACLSRRPFLSARSRSSNDISVDGRANETGRDFVEVEVELVPGGPTVTIISAHLKSGFDDATLLRRQVEVIRAARLIDVAAARGGVLFMGDFNEDIESGAGMTFARAPAGMPSSYRLGSDLSFPITYDPFATLAAAQVTAADARHEDSTNDATRIPSGRRIDYIMMRGVTAVAGQVYDPCVDNGVDDPPAGGRMELEGSPVPCVTAQAASDHWPLMVDLAPP